jgi:hypothetical protein
MLVAHRVRVSSVNDIKGSRTGNTPKGIEMKQNQGPNAMPNAIKQKIKIKINV